MTSTLTARAALTFTAVLGLTLVAAPTSAQIDGGAIDGGSSDVAPTSAALSATDFTFSILRFDPATASWNTLTPTEQAYFFGRARCECAADTTNWSGFVKIAIEPSAAAPDKIRALLAASGAGEGRAALYAGTNALNCLVPGAVAGTAPAYCLNLLDPSDYRASIAGGLSAFTTQRVWRSAPIPVAWLYNAMRSPMCNGTESCGQTDGCGSTGTALVYFWAQTSAGQAPDSSDLSFPVNLVGQAPAPPPHVTVEVGNQALGVQWEWPQGMEPAGHPSILGVQLFCQRSQGDQVFATGTFQAGFSSAATMCPAVAPAPARPLPFAHLSPAFVCSPLLPTTTTHYRIAGLQNDVPYGVAVAAVDKYGNVSASDLVFQFPNGTDADAGAADGGPTTTAGGGGCSLTASAGHRSGWNSLGLLALGALFVGRSRFRRRS